MFSVFTASFFAPVLPSCLFWPLLWCYSKVKSICFWIQWCLFVSLHCNVPSSHFEGSKDEPLPHILHWWFLPVLFLDNTLHSPLSGIYSSCPFCNYHHEALMLFIKTPVSGSGSLRETLRFKWGSLWSTSGELGLFSSFYLHRWLTANIWARTVSPRALIPSTHQGVSGWRWILNI